MAFNIDLFSPEGTARNPIMPLLPALVAGVLAAGCGGEARTDGGTAWRAQIDTIGDTIVVHTVAGSERGTGELIPEVRIGAEEGADDEIFGEITGLAVDSAGDVYVYDAQVPALRKYAPDGRFVATFGRKGGGPGEYAESDGGLAVLTDGRVVLRDPGNARLTMYAPDGTFLDSWRAQGGMYTSVPIVPTPDGGFFNAVYARGGLRLVHYAADGTPGDTVDFVNRRVDFAKVSAQTKSASQTWPVPFTPMALSVIHPDGYQMSAVSDEYAIDLLHRDGPVLRLVRDVEPVAVTAEERAAEEERVTRAMRQVDHNWRWNGPPIPKTKPLLAALYGGEDGRVWVQLHQSAASVPEEELEPSADDAPLASRVREPVVFDVFERDGRYVGQAGGPAAFSNWPTPVFRGDHVWATERDKLGVQYVVRYRVDWRP